MPNNTYTDNTDADSMPLGDALSVNTSLERKRKRAFWMRLFYAGVASYFTVLPTVLVYAALTWQQPHRVWITVIALASLAAMFATYLARGMIVTATQRQWVFFIGNTLSFVILELLCALDGGIDSPIAYLLVLPMVYLAICYRFRTALACAVTGLLCYGVLLWFAPGPRPMGVVIFQLLTMGVSFLMATLGARNRDQQNQAMRALRRQLESMAMTDALTGCLNQSAFKAVLQREVKRARRHGRALALLLIDIDHFKRINDNHGHLMGDVVLRQMGMVLRSAAREADCAGRPGGDELALLAPETDAAAAVALAERLCEEARSAALPIHITLSIGVCAMAPLSEQAAVVFQRADEALYMAKRGGRDKVALWKDADAATQRGPESVLVDSVK